MTLLAIMWSKTVGNFMFEHDSDEEITKKVADWPSYPSFLFKVASKR